MKKILRNVVCATATLFSAFGLTSCGDKPDSFSIESNSQVFYVDLNEPVKLTVSSGYSLKESSPTDVVFTIADNNCDGKVEKKTNGWYFSATTIGSATIEAYIGSLKSSNTLTISSLVSSNKIAENIASVLNVDGGVVLGQTYDIGVSKSDVPNYKISGADGILMINTDGKLEVCGIGQGKIDLNYNNESVFNGRYTVYNSTLATKIKEDLISQGKIQSKSDLVPNELFDFITTLDMKGELINDPSASYGIKYFRNLKTLDLSSNGLTDASFISTLSNLETLILKDNGFTDISSIVENENLKKLDLSNNSLTKITNLQYLYKIEYLDLSDNYITNIAPLSSSYSLKSLFLNNNKVENFKDSLSGLEDLVELGIGNCGISFTDIISLRYLPNIEYLDISGTKPTLKTIATTLTKLKTLKVSNCNLDSLIGDDSLSFLNNLTKLEVLDISHNDLDMEKWNESVDNPYIKGENFENLKELYIGGNEFSSFPNLSKFESLKVLDVSESNNLTDVSSLASLNIKTLVLDNCNSIAKPNFASIILGNEKIEKLSTIGAFNYLDKTNFDALVLAVSQDKISWRFLTDVWTTSTSISNYTKIVYFSMSEFLSSGTVQDQSTGAYTIKEDGNSEIILSLINDLGSLASTHYKLNVPKGIFRIQLYGNKYYSYDISFNVLERKESSLTLNLYNFKDNVSSANGHLVKTQPGAKLIVNACSGENTLKGGDGTIDSSNNKVEPGNAINGYDVKITSLKGSSISLYGGTGAHGKDGGNVFSGENGHRGQAGADAIRCHDCTLVSGSMTIRGGDGGKGGASAAFYKSGDGGAGGNGISYSNNFYNNSSATINGGTGGQGGQGDGSWGSAGANGSATAKI